MTSSDFVPAYLPATPNRIRQNLYEEHNLPMEEIDFIFSKHGDEIKAMIDRGILTYAVANALQLLNNGAP